MILAREIHNARGGGCLTHIPPLLPPKANGSSQTNKISANCVVALTGVTFIAVLNTFGVGGDVVALLIDPSKKLLLL